MCYINSRLTYLLTHLLIMSIHQGDTLVAIHTTAQLLLTYVCCVKLRTRLEEELSMSLTELRHFIDEEMLTVMRQMDAPSQIFDYLYLGSEWNASNLDELKKIGFVYQLLR